MSPGFQGAPMLSKCANPDCTERFLFLHRGKLFHLTPTPEVEAFDGGNSSALYERFWLCDRCAKTMTLVWAGTEARVVPLPSPEAVLPAVAAGKIARRKRVKKHAANAGP
jgi:hypothetical protein